MGTFAIIPSDYCLCATSTDDAKLRVTLAALYAEGTLTWESSDEAIARFEDHTTGVVTGLARGLVEVTATDTLSSGERRTATANIWVGDLDLDVPQGKSGVPSPHASSVGLDIDQSVTFTANEKVTWGITSARDPVPAGVLSIDRSTGEAKALGLGMVVVTATNDRGNVAYVAVRCGTLLVYGADGELYMVQAGSWAHTRVARPPIIPTLATMNATAQTSPEELAIWVPTTDKWTTCYVLNPAAAPTRR